MDKYIARSRLTALDSAQKPSYLHSTAKAAALSRYSHLVDISPIKLDLDLHARTADRVILTELKRSMGEQAIIKAELDRNRAIQSQQRFSLRSEIDANQDCLNIQRQKQRILADDLSIIELQISNLLRRRQQRMRKQLLQLEDLDVRASDVNRDLRDSQFRLDAHDAMIRGLQKMSISGR